MNLRTQEDFRGVAPVGYERLWLALVSALRRAAVGKGRDRHAGEGGEPFEDQPIFTIPKLEGDTFGAWHREQAHKKLQEAAMFARSGQLERAISELQDAINYSGANIMLLDDLRLASDFASDHPSPTADEVVTHAVAGESQGGRFTQPLDEIEFITKIERLFGLMPFEEGTEIEALRSRVLGVLTQQVRWMREKAIGCLRVAMDQCGDRMDSGMRTHFFNVFEQYFSDLSEQELRGTSGVSEPTRPDDRLCSFDLMREFLEAEVLPRLSAAPNYPIQSAEILRQFSALRQGEWEHPQTRPAK